MRIKKLVITGFGPYKDEQHIDFESFRDDGLFLITGKTGAGKSSILDAICYALYGSIPRYDNTQQKLRSDHCAPEDPTFVQLDFAVHETDYRVRRSPEYERIKKSGTGTTMTKTTAELSILVDGQWRATAVGPKEVGIDLDRILGLTKDQFLQVILLAQNRFQEFLLAKNDDRQAVLRSLFGTRRFEQIETTLVENRKALQTDLAAMRASLGAQAARIGDLLEDSPAEVAGAPDDLDSDDLDSDDLDSDDPDAVTLDWFDAAIVTLDDRLVSAKLDAALADADFTEADDSHRVLANVQKLQQRRNAAATTLTSLESERPDIDTDRVTLEAAHRAAAVWPQLSAKLEADAELETATSDELLARDAYQTLLDSAADSASDGVFTNSALKATIDEVTRRLGSLESVLAEESLLAALVVEMSVLHDRATECAAAVDKATARIEELPRRIDLISTDLAAASTRANRESTANELVVRLSGARDAAKTALTLTPEHADALVAETAASGENAAAAIAVHALMQQRLNGHAAELASDLSDGDACAVCGSTEHPEPAKPAGASVTEEDIERARIHADERKAAMDAARDVAHALSVRLAEAITKSDAKSIEQLDTDLGATEAVLADARQASDEVASLELEQQQLRAQLEAAKASLADLRIAKDEATKQLAAIQGKRTTIEERVEKHAGAYDSVSDHVEHLLAHLEAANLLVDAIARTQAQKKTWRTAGTVLRKHLLEQQLADEDAVISARRTPAEISACDDRIRAFDQAVATAKATLAEPELGDLPDALVDLTAASDDREQHRAIRDRTLAAASALEQRCSQAARIAASARRQHATSADLQKKYAHLNELTSVVQGKEPNTRRMRLETYVLAAQLEEIVAAANVRLRTMSGGRYALEHDDAVQFRNAQSGLGLSVLDEHTGRARSPHSLSGGEMFLASLALALGLAEVVTNQSGGITLDTLFIDEGFGSLDSDTLEVAMGTLDGLRAGGRTIGLISHVDAMKEQIAAKLHIVITGKGHSEIEKSLELV